MYTAEQFQQAFHLGVRDIEIRSHLDLRALPLETNPITGLDAGELSIGWVGRTTRSIRVCSYYLPQTDHEQSHLFFTTALPRTTSDGLSQCKHHCNAKGSQHVLSGQALTGRQRC